MGFLEPQVMEDGLPAVAQECVQNRTPEQLVDVPVPQIMEAIAENRFPEHLVDVPVPQIVEAVAEKSFPGADCEFSCLSSLRPLWRIVLGSRSWIPLCLCSWGKTWKPRFLHLRRACKIIRWSRWWTSLPLRIWKCMRDVCVQNHRSGCRIVFWSQVMDVPLPHIKQGAFVHRESVHSDAASSS